VKDLDRAEHYATETYDLASAAATRINLDDDTNLEIALGAAIEVLATVSVERGARADAVVFLERERDTYRGTAIHARVQKNINLLSLTGEPAPALDTVDLASLRGRVVLLFFWAHWCSDCKAQSPIVARLLEKHGPRGFTVVGPTQRYGYIGSREDVGEAEELAHIEAVRAESYAFLRPELAPVSEVNLQRYGASTTPTLVLVDRRGIVRHYRPGRLAEAELDALIDRLLAD
jgi:thiol-disulfide isomerase/thioredoxin